MTSDRDGIDIVEVEEILGQAEPLPVLVPLLEGTRAGEPGQVEIDADDLQAAASEGYNLSSSLVPEADQ
ncbi:MAG: hypothetical protein JO082_09560, partial [Mycobacterium sp.]|nr:hypothetical protein [Mycobacterium sp.]